MLNGSSLINFATILNLSKHHILTAPLTLNLLWVIISISIVTQQANFYGHSMPSESHAKSSNKNKPDSEKSVISISNDAIVTVPNINIDHGLYQIKEIIFEEDNYLGMVLQDEPNLKSSYKRTLFRQVISPNAP